MSFTAHMWASGIAEVANVYEYAVLNRMADEADEFGEGCCLGTPTIANDIKANERSVRRAIDSLLERGLLAEGDQRRAAYIRADRRPKVYDLMIPAVTFGDLKRTNERRAAKGLPPITPENRPMQKPPAADDMRTPRSDTGQKRERRVGFDQVEQDALDHATEQKEQDGGTNSHPVTTGLSVTPSSTGGLPVHDDLTGSPRRPDYQSPDPGIDPGVDPTIKTPPLLSEINSLARETSPSQGGDLSDTERRLLSAAVQQAVEARDGSSGWTQSAVVDAMQAQLDAGFTAAKVAAAMIAAAGDEATNYPGRIGYLLKTASTPAIPAAAPPAPDWAQGSIKYLDPRTPRCRVAGHRSEPEVGCGKCKADAVVAGLGEPEPAERPEEAEGVTGPALARKIAAAAKRGPAVKPRRPGPAPSAASAPPSRFGEVLSSLADAMADVMGGAS